MKRVIEKPAKTQYFPRHRFSHIRRKRPRQLVGTSITRFGLGAAPHRRTRNPDCSVFATEDYPGEAHGYAQPDSSKLFD